MTAWNRLGGMASIRLTSPELRALGTIPGRAARVMLHTGPPPLETRVRGLLASWEAGTTPGCGCLKCLILGTAAAELAEVLVQDP
jgi:hypothetical protein